MKALKREEIIEKLKKAEFLAGNVAHDNEGKSVGILADRKVLERAEKELNTEFIPDLYDKTMDALFDDKYYDADELDGKELEKTKDIDMRLMKDQIDGIGKGEEASDLVSDVDSVDEEQAKKFVKDQSKQKEKQYEEQLAQSMKKQVEE